jgi:glutathionylspermidine synthase
MKIIKVHPVPGDIFEKLGFYWYKSPDKENYVADELVVISEKEGDAYYAAANELYEMFVAAGQHIIDNKLYELCDIPDNLIDLIETSWEDDSHFHLLGRFDFAGGQDGLPIKLIEFNADTPSMIFEVSLIQWMLLRHNGLSEDRQYNSLYETLKESFLRMKELHPDYGPHRDGIPHILFSCMDADLEDENTTRLMEEIAYEAGFITGFEYVHKVHFAANIGVMNGDGDVFDYWYKYLPYECIGREEPELAGLLTEIVKRGKAKLVNPPYTLLFQSKTIMKVLWDIYPCHPLLLETSLQPRCGKKCVEKRTFGREGANIAILDASGGVIQSTDGEYQSFKPVYQDYAALPCDGEGNAYQAGVFFSYEACGLGFRREKGIINNQSQFVGHFVEG